MLLLLACSAANPQRPDTSDASEAATSHAVRCTLDPALTETPGRLRVAGDGAVWIVDILGILSRYTRVEGEDCALTGGPIPGATDTFQEVTDIAVDPSGALWSLVFFDELRRLGADGLTELSCQVTAGHTLAVGETQAWVWGVGEEALYPVDLTAESCADTTSPLPIAQPISPTARWSSRGLAAAAFDSGGDLPPGFLIDLGTGAVGVELGTGAAPSGEELAVISDIYVTGNGYVVVDGFSSLWSINAEGEVSGVADTEALLPLSGDNLESPLSLDYAGGDQYYLATNASEGDSVWLLDL